MMRFSQVRCPVSQEEETSHDVQLRAWHGMRFWAAGDHVETGFELASGSVYSGDLSPAGAPDGAGRLTSDQQWEYSGEFAGGAPNGEGTMRVAGSHIEGIFARERLVDGACALPGGMVYEGQPDASGRWTFEASTQTKRGTKSKIRVRCPGGESYEGDMIDGVPHGVGTRTAPSGRKYRGQFQNGMRHGAGRMVLATGENLQGTFLRRGNLTGEGKIELQGGGEMSGNFAHGRLHGAGLYRASNGVSWRGNFEDSTLTGPASMTCPAESRHGTEVFPEIRYEGHVAGDRANGEGEVAFGNVKFRGSWHNGQVDGQGMFREDLGKKGELSTIMLFREGMRDDVFSEFAGEDSFSDDD